MRGQLFMLRRLTGEVSAPIIDDTGDVIEFLQQIFGIVGNVQFEYQL